MNKPIPLFRCNQLKYPVDPVSILRDLFISEPFHGLSVPV